MGLDMFIFKIKRYSNATFDDVVAVRSYLDLQEYKKEHPGYKCSFAQWSGRKKVPPVELVKYYQPMYEEGLIQEVAYWRKANAVHKWFVDNVQDGEDDCSAHRELTREDLEELRDLAHQVRCNPDLAEKLLPTESGFFFGGTQYDDWYFEGIENTVDQLDKVLKETDFETEALYYVSSW